MNNLAVNENKTTSSFQFQKQHNQNVLNKIDIPIRHHQNFLSSCVSANVVDHDFLKIVSNSSSGVLMKFES